MSNPCKVLRLGSRCTGPKGPVRIETMTGTVTRSAKAGCTGPKGPVRIETRKAESITVKHYTLHRPERAGED